MPVEMVQILRSRWTWILSPIFMLASRKGVHDSSLLQTLVRSLGESFKHLKLSLSTLYTKFTIITVPFIHAKNNEIESF